MSPCTQKLFSTQKKVSKIFVQRQDVSRRWSDQAVCAVGAALSAYSGERGIGNLFRSLLGVRGSGMLGR